MSAFGIIFGAILCIGLIIFSSKQIISIVKSIRNRKKDKIEKKEG